MPSALVRWSRAPMIGWMLLSGTASADLLPGFRIEKVASTRGFLTSITFDENDALLYSAQSGEIYRLEGDQSDLVAKLETASEGNSGLLGIAFEPNGTIVAHHVSADLKSDLITRVDPTDGSSTLLAELIAAHGWAAPTEHHGGNPVVDSAGTIYVGVGDFGVFLPAQDLESPGGKVIRIALDGTVSYFAMGFRNPFDLAVDEQNGRLIVTDNGPIGEDELNLVYEGDNCGWPQTAGLMPSVARMQKPYFVFDGTVAPTGLLLMNGSEGLPSAGALVASFSRKGIYYFPEIGDRTPSAPILLFSDEIAAAHEVPIHGEHLIDVARNGRGELYFGSPTAIYRLVPPVRGDVNGDGNVDERDMTALLRELDDGDGNSVFDVQHGGLASTWGCDVNRDRLVNMMDVVALSRLRPRRKRAVQ